MLSHFLNSVCYVCSILLSCAYSTFAQDCGRTPSVRSAIYSSWTVSSLVHVFRNALLVCVKFLSLFDHFGGGWQHGVLMHSLAGLLSSVGRYAVLCRSYSQPIMEYDEASCRSRFSSALLSHLCLILKVCPWIRLGPILQCNATSVR